MEDVILIKVESTADLEPEQNIIVLDTTTGKRYWGNGTTLVEMLDRASQPIREVTTADELLFTDFIVECQGTFNFDLPDPSGLASGQIFYINNNGSGTISVIPFGTSGIQTVGNATYSLAQDESICICINANSNGWLILSKA
jgi:hypothetical protein